MNKGASRIVISSLSLVVGIAALTTYLLTQPSSIAVARPFPDSSVKEIAGYRAWTKVNPQPYLMRAASALDCAAPTTVSPPGVKNPHQDKFVTVYVNDVGRRAMLEMRNPAFLVGSVIVKEKLSERSSTSPELLTVMIKREKGFNEGMGDWEYMVTDGDGVSIQARGKLENCQACHVSRPQNDYIFRSYLPNDVRSKLK